MEYKSKKPIYIQIVELIIMDIIKETIKPGNKFPTIKQMSIQYQVNPNTIQSVFKELESLDLVNSKRGLGIFLTEDLTCIESQKNNFIEQRINDFLDDMKKIGLEKEDIIKVLNKEEGRNV